MRLFRLRSSMVAMKTLSAISRHISLSRKGGFIQKTVLPLATQSPYGFIILLSQSLFHMFSYKFSSIAPTVAMLG